jgi:hypothetical protein
VLESVDVSHHSVTSPPQSAWLLNKISYLEFPKHVSIYGNNIYFLE